MTWEIRDRPGGGKKKDNLVHVWRHWAITPGETGIREGPREIFGDLGTLVLRQCHVDRVDQRNLDLVGC